MDDPERGSGVPTEERLPFSPAVGCGLSVLTGGLCAAAFFAILWFNQRGEIAFAPDPLRVTRVWIVRDGGIQGLGVSSTRPLPGRTATEACTRTSVRFLLIRPAEAPSADVDYCECFALGPGGWSPTGPCGEPQ